MRDAPHATKKHTASTSTSNPIAKNASAVKTPSEKNPINATQASAAVQMRSAMPVGCFGEIARERHESYLSIYQDLASKKPWEKK